VVAASAASPSALAFARGVAALRPVRLVARFGRRAGAGRAVLRCAPGAPFARVLFVFPSPARARRFAASWLWSPFAAWRLFSSPGGAVFCGGWLGLCSVRARGSVVVVSVPLSC